MIGLDERGKRLFYKIFDYCNTLLAPPPPPDIINRLQMAQNTAALLITRSRKRVHISPILHHLHWPPVKKYISYKIYVIKCLNQTAHSYLSEILKVYVPARQLRSSADQSIIVVPTSNLKSSGYPSLVFFYYLGPRLCSNLPRKIREVSSI